MPQFSNLIGHEVNDNSNAAQLTYNAELRLRNY